MTSPVQQSSVPFAAQLIMMGRRDRSQPITHLGRDRNRYRAEATLREGVLWWNLLLSAQGPQGVNGTTNVLQDSGCSRYRKTGLKVLKTFQ